MTANYISILQEVFDDRMVLDGGASSLERKVQAKMRAVHEIQLGLVDDVVAGGRGGRRAAELSALDRLEDGQQDRLELGQLLLEVAHELEELGRLLRQQRELLLLAHLAEILDNLGELGAARPCVVVLVALRHDRGGEFARLQLAARLEHAAAAASGQLERVQAEVVRVELLEHLGLEGVGLLLFELRVLVVLDAIGRVVGGLLLAPRCAILVIDVAVVVCTTFVSVLFVLLGHLGLVAVAGRFVLVRVVLVVVVTRVRAVECQHFLVRGDMRRPLRVLQAAE